MNNGSKKIIYRKTVDGLFLYLYGKEEIFIAGKEFKGKDKKVAKMTRDGLTEEEMLQRLEQSRESSKRGNYRNADDVISDIRGKYGL